MQHRADQLQNRGVNAYSPAKRIHRLILVDRVENNPVRGFDHDTTSPGAVYGGGRLMMNGPMARGSDFDRDVIAAGFAKPHEGTVTDREVVLN